MTRTQSTKSAVGEHREALLAARSRLLSELGRQPQPFSEDGRGSSDDDPTLLHDQFVALRVSSLAAEKLRLIDEALARLDEGSYGICDDCGGVIPPKRLAALPWAVYCVPCQERRAALSEDVDRAA
jgi:DnaK suppressor protein